ncbi:hypothetical protein ACOME3_008407 [Neoechinorhynchus agilis]
MSFLFRRNSHRQKASSSTTNLQQDPVDHKYSSSSRSQTLRAPVTTVSATVPPIKLQKSTSLLDVLKQKIARRTGGQSLSGSSSPDKAAKKPHFWRRPSKLSVVTAQLSPPPLQPMEPSSKPELKANNEDIDRKYELIKAKYYSEKREINARQQSNLRISCLVNGYSSKAYPSAPQQQQQLPASTQPQVEASFTSSDDQKQQESTVPETVMDINSSENGGDCSAGIEYLQKLDTAYDRLDRRCRNYEIILLDQADSGDKEELCGSIQAAIGQSRLLMAKRMEHVRKLCYDNMCPSKDKPLTTGNDLAGYWDVLQTQIDSCNRSFDCIEEVMADKPVEEKAQHNDSYEIETLSSSGTSSLSSTTVGHCQRDKVVNAKPAISSSSSSSSAAAAAIPSKSIELRRMIREKRKQQRETNGGSENGNGQVADI